MKWARVGVSLLLILTAFTGNVTTVRHSTADDRSDLALAPKAQLSPQDRSGASAPKAHGEVVVIGVENAQTNRSIAPMVREAAAYWERYGVRYTGHRFEYRVEPNASNPTYRVRVVDSIDKCGPNGTYLACTGVVAPGDPVTDHRIRVVDGMSRESLVYSLVHEFGHTLGLRHGDRPVDVMNASYDVQWATEE